MILKIDQKKNLIEGFEVGQKYWEKNWTNKKSAHCLTQGVIVPPPYIIFNETLIYNCVCWDGKLWLREFIIEITL